MNPTNTHARFSRFASSVVKTTPVDTGGVHRLEIPYFAADPSKNPNGQVRPDFVQCVATVVIGGDFQFAVRVEKSPDGPVLAVETKAVDLLLATKEDMALTLPLLKAVYAELGRRYIKAQAKQQRQGAGRN